MEQAAEIVRRLCRTGAWLGGIMLLACAIMVSIEVVLRKLFVVSVGGANELSTYALAISACWAFGFGLMERAHIRIDSVYRRLPHKACVVVDLASVFSIVAFAALLSWHMYGVWLKSFELGSRANTPLGTLLWIPQGLYLLGLIFFLLVAVFVFIRAAGTYLKGDFDEVTRQIGTVGVEEEITRQKPTLGQAASAGGTDQ